MPILFINKKPRSCAARRPSRKPRARGYALLGMPLHVFTINADRDTHLRFRIYVWKNYSALQRARRKGGRKEKGSPLCDGFTHQRHNRHSFDFELGSIHLNAKDLSIDTIAHECVHAACEVARVWRVSDRQHSDDSRDLTFGAGSSHVEEMVAYPTGYMTEGITWNLLRLKLKIKPFNVERSKNSQAR